MTTRPDTAAVLPTIHQRVAGRLRQWADAMDAKTPILDRRGKRLAFTRSGANLGHPIYVVTSVRGGFRMGRIEWSNQWRAAKFTPDAEAVFDMACLAELYAFCRELK